MRLVKRHSHRLVKKEMESMRRNKTIEAIENEQMKESIPSFRQGDTVSVEVRVREGG